MTLHVTKQVPKPVQDSSGKLPRKSLEICSPSPLLCLQKLPVTKNCCNIETSITVMLLRPIRTALTNTWSLDSLAMCKAGSLPARITVSEAQKNAQCCCSSDQDATNPIPKTNHVVSTKGTSASSHEGNTSNVAGTTTLLTTTAVRQVASALLKLGPLG